ncbi:Cytochrome P450 [Rhypophila decipiens]
MALTTIAQPILLGATALAALYLIARGIYLYFFHPLARYPGPFLAKFTDLYGAYHALRGDIHLDMWRCHQKYGDHVRYGPNKLTFNTADGLRDIYSNSALGKIVKSDSYEPLVHRAPNTLTIRGGKEHARRRRIMSQGVSEKAQRGYEDRVVSHILNLCNAVFPVPQQNNQEPSPQWSEPLDMSEWCYYLSFDIMADVVFSAKYNLLTSPKFRYVTSCIDASNVRMSVLIQAPWIARLPIKIDKKIFRSAIQARNRFVKFVSRVVGDRLKKQAAASELASKEIELAQDDPVNEINGDVFSNLAAAKDPETGEGFAINEIAAESTTLIVAGSDTTSTAFASILFYLADNKSAYEKAAAEVRSKFSSREEVFMGPALASCTYLKACVDEAMRMSPPVGLALWREVISPGGMVLDKTENIPAGTHVGVPLYSIHHSDRYYDSPFEYKPERWLEDDGTGSIERGRSVFNPFSLGMRGCLGKGLANTEMMLTLATLLWTGDFKFAGGERGLVGRGGSGGFKDVLGRQRKNEYQLFDHVTSQKMGPWLQFKARGG